MRCTGGLKKKFLLEMPAQYFPFKGIVDIRPYRQTGLTTERWMKEVPVRSVPFENLFLTQAGVLIAPLFSNGSSYTGDSTPHTVLWRGNYYLEDGHHRVTRAALEGHLAVWARVFMHPLDRGLVKE